MRIDWNKGKWRVWTLDGALLAEAESVSIRVPGELVNADKGHRGFLVVHGTIVKRDSGILILPVEEESDG